MTENDKPLFPRESETDSEAQKDLLQDVKQKLEAAESRSEIESPDFSNERFMPPMDVDVPRPPAPVYGPPPLLIPPVPMYGPPPLPVRRKPIFVFILVGFLLALFGIYLVITLLR